MWYLVLAPPLHFQGKTWPGSEGWLVPPLVPPDPEPMTMNQRNQHLQGGAMHSLFTRALLTWESLALFSIFSQATVSLMLYWSPKNHVSLSPKVRHTKSKRSFPFHLTWSTLKNTLKYKNFFSWCIKRKHKKKPPTKLNTQKIQSVAA